MASYDFTNRGSTTYGKGRLGSKVPADTPNSTDLGNVTKSDRPQDHVCRTVIVNADGTITPGIEVLPQQNQQQKETDSHVSKIDEVVERVYAPLAAAHGHTSAAHNGRSKPVGQLVDKANPFNEVSNDVQTASTWTGFPSNMFQHQTPNNYGGNTGTNAWGRPSGGTYGTSTNRWSKSGDGTYRSGTDGWSKLHGGTYDSGSNGLSRSGDGTYNVNNGWGKPNHVSWATPTSYKIPPTKTTNDVDSAVDYVRESISPHSITMAPWQGQFSASSPTYPTRETVLETIDNREASRRYGNSTASPWTIQEIYSTSINSREAARKYSGSFV